METSLPGVVVTTNGISHRRPGFNTHWERVFLTLPGLRNHDKVLGASKIGVCILVSYKWETEIVDPYVFPQKIMRQSSLAANRGENLGVGGRPNPNLGNSPEGRGGDSTIWGLPRFHGSRQPASLTVRSQPKNSDRFLGKIPLHHSWTQLPIPPCKACI